MQFLDCFFLCNKADNNNHNSSTGSVEAKLTSNAIQYTLLPTKEANPKKQNQKQKKNLTFFAAMDDYTREMMDLKTLVTRTLEKKGVLARIRVRFFNSSP